MSPWGRVIEEDPDERRSRWKWLVGLAVVVLASLAVFLPGFACTPEADEGTPREPASE